MMHLTPHVWHEQAGLNMSQAQQSHRFAHFQQDKSRRAHSHSVNTNLSMYQDLEASLKEKVGNSQKLIQQLTRRAASLNSSIEDTKQALVQLEAGLQATHAPLDRCRWRMQQRAARPPREVVRDDVELSLEAEESTLLDVQRKLGAAIKQAKKMLHLLQCRLEVFKNDIDQKKQSLGVDDKCLRNTQESHQTHYHTVMRNMPGPLSSSEEQSDWHRTNILEHSANEMLRQHDVGRLDKSARNQEDIAKSLCSDSRQLIRRCQLLMEQASKSTNLATKHRVGENQEVRTRLKEQINETQAKIDSTKAVLADTSHQISALKEPIALNDTCNSWRQMDRATLERIHDPVSTKLREQHHMVKRTRDHLARNHSHEQEVLEELRRRRERLKADLNDKTEAYNIDLNCLQKDITQRDSRLPTPLRRNRPMTAR